MADIFISYATVDRLVVDRLVDALKACGWSVWWDHRSLRGGQRFDRIIEEAIRTARIVIVIWSKISVEREWVLDEATLALRMKKLVPLRIDMAHLPMRFSNIHTIDFSSWTGKTDAEPFKRLVEDLSHYLGPPPEPVPIHPDPQPPPNGDPFLTRAVAKLRAPIAELISLAGLKQAAKRLRKYTVQHTTCWVNAAMNSSYSMVLGLFSQPARSFALVARIGGLMIVITAFMILEQRSTALQEIVKRGEYATALNLARPAAENGD
jgi:hypothetical protein